MSTHAQSCGGRGRAGSREAGQPRRAAVLPRPIPSHPPAPPLPPDFDNFAPIELYEKVRGGPARGARAPDAAGRAAPEQAPLPPRAPCVPAAAAPATHPRSPPSPAP